jgi:hypothetical protein
MSEPTSDLVDQLAAIRQELAVQSQQLTALFDQQKELAALVGRLLPLRGGEPAAEPVEHHAAVPGREILARCGQDLLRVLREVGRPLTTLEILDALVQRHRSWPESTVSHTLADLKDQGLVCDSGGSGPHRHRLMSPPAPQATPAI